MSFFPWNLLHCKILTTDNLWKKAGRMILYANFATLPKKIQNTFAKIVVILNRVLNIIIGWFNLATISNANHQSTIYTC